VVRSLAIPLLLAFALPASALPLQFRFSGQITWPTGTDGYQPGLPVSADGLSPGSGAPGPSEPIPFLLDFTIDTEFADTPFTYTSGAPGAPATAQFVGLPNGPFRWDGASVAFFDWSAADFNPFPYRLTVCAPYPPDMDQWCDFGIAMAGEFMAGPGTATLLNAIASAPNSFTRLSFTTPLTGSLSIDGLDFGFGPDYRGAAPDAGVSGTLTLSVVPEPGTLALFCLGLIALGFARGRRPSLNRDNQMRETR